MIYNDLTVPQFSLPEDIQYKFGYIINKRGERLFWRSWSSPTKKVPSSLVVIQHGYTDYGDRYHHVASYLVRSGFAVFALDALGHGRSEGTRGHINDYDNYVEDLRLGISFFKSKYVELPVSVLAHSNGGLMALRHAFLYPNEVSAYALSSPYCGMNLRFSAFVMPFLRRLAKVSPDWSISSKLVPLPKTTHVKAVTDWSLKDPLSFNSTTLGWVAESSRAQKDLFEHAHLIKQPMLFLVSGEDQIVDANKTKELYKKISSETREYHLIPRAYHENLNEKGWQERLELISKWFSDHAENFN